MPRGWSMNAPNEYGVAGVGALNPDQLPIKLKPGEKLRVSRVRFSYIGPQIVVRVLMALKPKTGFFGTDWNNGNNVTINSNYFRASGEVQINGASVPTNVEIPFPPDSSFYLMTPTPGNYPLQSGGVGSFGVDIDTWIAICNASLISLSGLSSGWQNLADEKFLLSIDTDQGVLRVI